MLHHLLARSANKSAKTVYFLVCLCNSVPRPAHHHWPGENWAELSTELQRQMLQCRNVDQRAGGSHSQAMSEDHARAITRRETMVTINMGCRFIPAHTRFTACKHDLQSLQGVNIIYKLYSCKYPRPCRDPHLNWLPGTLAQANNEIAFRQSWAARWPGMEESVAKLG